MRRLRVLAAIGAALAVALSSATAADATRCPRGKVHPKGKLGCVPAHHGKHTQQHY